jgi:CxxC motif-containing protein (DUF1111 family)
VFEALRSQCCLLWLAAVAACFSHYAWAAENTEASVKMRGIGGALTHYDRSRDAYSRPAPGLSSLELRRFGLGNRVFNTRWVEAPASVSGFDGLGPVFNRDSCSGCHQRDGRGRPPDPEVPALKETFVVKVSTIDQQSQRRLAKTFGPQLNTAAIAKVRAEGEAVIEYEEKPGQYADGSAFSLRKPKVHLADPLYRVSRHLRFSMRVAPAVFGLGLIEAVPDRVIEDMADPNDRDRDGISGRVNRVASFTLAGSPIGRFGWKAHAATLTDQTIDAAFQDIGLTSRWQPTQNCAPRPKACQRAFANSEVELGDRLIEAAVGYLQMLGVPARAEPSDRERRAAGAALFQQLGCIACHRPTLSTGDTHALVLLHNQTFSPYSDLLLHDMGEGLAGGGNDGSARDNEWRTPPLWGLSLLQTVNGHTLLLHDGRARSVDEAILWHGGEGQAAREAFRRAPLKDRKLLAEFVLGL